MVEMLSVISVIGVLAAIAVPTVSRINDSSEEAKNKRNAQSLASIFSSASAAGLDFLAPDDDLEVTITNIVDGGYATGGPFDGAYFGLNLTEDDQSGAINYLEIQGGMLRYAPAGSSAGSVGVDLPFAALMEEDPEPPIALEARPD